MQIFNFVALSVIIDPHNVLIPHVSKSHLPIVLFNVREFELMLKRAVKEKGRPPYMGGRGPTLSRKALTFIKQSSPSSWRYTSSECGSILS